MSGDQQFVGVVSYANNSTKTEKSLREGGFLMMFLGIAISLFVPLLPTNPPKRWWAVLPFEVFLVPMAIFGAILAPPWQSTLDYDSRTIKTHIGFRP